MTKSIADDEPPSVALAPDVEAWLRAGAGASAKGCEKVIETSISWIFLYPDRALKLKKPVDLVILDFTTPDKRRWASQRELTFNAPGAPDIYRRVRAITRAASGTLSFDGPGEVVEWALEMRRFDDTAVLLNRLSQVDGAFAETLGRRIAAFHATAAVGAVGGGAPGLGYILASNARLLRHLASHLGKAAVERLIATTDAAFTELSPLLDRRMEQGFVRCCHGDLHLGNILLEAGQPILFDCIEFNDRLREIDILYDVGFLLMDLAFRGAPEAANRVLNGWLDQAARTFSAGPWEGLAALGLYQSVRAAVRAHVNGMEGRHDESRRYLAAAQAHLEPGVPALIALGGLSGSGKSTLARALAPRLGAAPGAVVLRSDEIRKRLWGRDPTAALPPEAYAPQASVSVYKALFSAARACLAAGKTVVADAVFLRPEERAGVEALAAASGAAFHGLWLEAPPEILRHRIESRRGDASDADARVLALQLTRDPGDIRWPRRADANTPEGLARVWRDLAGQDRRAPT